MDYRAILTGVTTSFVIFAYFSLPTLRQLYGEVALLVVYGGMAILSGIIVYVIVARIANIAEVYLGDEIDEEDEDNEKEQSEEDKSESVVKKEIDSLKNN